MSVIIWNDSRRLGSQTRSITVGSLSLFNLIIEQNETYWKVVAGHLSIFNSTPAYKIEHMKTKCPIINNYSPKARWLSGNIHRDEVEVNIPRKSLSLRRIIVLVFLHIQMNKRNNCPSLICIPKLYFYVKLFVVLKCYLRCCKTVFILKMKFIPWQSFTPNFVGSFGYFRIEFILISFISLSVICTNG